MRKITITEALNELKLYDAKIYKAISNCNLVNAGKKSSDMLGHMKKTTFIDKAKADFQSVNDLIKNRDAMKKAVVLSNATTEVTINNETMTVAAAIEKKSSIEYLKDLLNSMKSQYAVATEVVEKNNTKMEAQIDKMLESFVGKDSDKKLNKEDFANISEPYKAANEFELVDPLDIANKITELESYIMGFESNVDTCLSISNSITYVVVE